MFKPLKIILPVFIGIWVLTTGMTMILAPAAPFIMCFLLGDLTAVILKILFVLCWISSN